MAGVGLLIEQARTAGLSVSVTGDDLVIRGPKAAEPIVRRLLAAKGDVIAELRAAQPPLDTDDIDRWSDALAAANRQIPELVPSLKWLRDGGTQLIERDGQILIGPWADFTEGGWASGDEWRADYLAVIGDLADVWRGLLAGLIESREAGGMNECERKGAA